MPFDMEKFMKMINTMNEFLVEYDRKLTHLEFLRMKTRFLEEEMAKKQNNVHNIQTPSTLSSRTTNKKKKNSKRYSNLFIRY